ncbi:hypothetical protein GGX14DRAFT_658735 [Mycena pura]|uniref:MER3 helicase-like winged helix domain-containing protein n=1 Tax=Mycena pura TaxID=153505 RepID=A0AAD6V322_9AGAR|nr:hypothetical protein GGX14DRAFT_658735 [Mycena pura]
MSSKPFMLRTKTSSLSLIWDHAKHKRNQTGTIYAEFALLRLWGNSVQFYAVCIEPYQKLVDMRVKEWRDKFSQVQGKKEIVNLTGKTSFDAHRSSGTLSLECSEDRLTADEVQLDGGEVGSAYEVVISRTRRTLAHDIPEVGPTLPYSEDNSLMLFSARPLDTDIHTQSFTIPPFPSLFPPVSNDASLLKTSSHTVRLMASTIASQLPRTALYWIPLREHQQSRLQSYEGREHRYIDYPVMDVLQMMGRACRPSEDDRSRTHLSRHIFRRTSYFLIAVKTIENKQDAMWTCFYRRTTQISNYYNLHNVSYQHLSDHLSELVETMLVDLVNSKSIAVEDEIDVSALNLGMESALAFLFSSKTRQSGARPRAIRLAHVDTNFSFALAAVQFKGLQARPRKHSGGTRVRHARQFQSLRLLRLIRAGGGKSQSSPQRKTKSAYVSRLDALKVLGDIITFRFREFESRDLATARDTQLRTQATSGDDKYAHNRRERRKGAWTVRD